VSTDSIIHTQHQDMGAEHAKSSVTAAHVTALPYLAHYNAESGPLIHRAINTILLCAALVTLTVLASFFFSFNVRHIPKKKKHGSLNTSFC
jgi:hypothetical protein